LGVAGALVGWASGVVDAGGVGVGITLELKLVVGATVGAAWRGTIDPPVKRITVPSTMLKATAAFKPKDAYQRQSLFWTLGFDLLGIPFLQISQTHYTTIRSGYQLLPSRG
jgi:hypothetical protein